MFLQVEFLLKTDNFSVQWDNISILRYNDFYKWQLLSRYSILDFRHLCH